MSRHTPECLGNGYDDNCDGNCHIPQPIVVCPVHDGDSTPFKGHPPVCRCADKRRRPVDIGYRPSSDPVYLLRRAVRGHDDWPDQGTAAAVVDAARRLIRAIDQRAEMIDHMRRNVTPTQEAIQQIIGEPK